MAAAAAVTAAISQSVPVTQMHNWMRLCLGSEYYNKEAVRNVLHNKFNNPVYHGLPENPALLFQELKKFQSDLSKLKTKHRITSAQWQLLYPSTKQTHSTQFDIPLMVILLEHCTDLPAPVKGWNDSNPPLSDQRLGANSLRARSMRHFLYHYGNPMSMDNNEFSTKWTELEDIQKGLGCTSVNMLDLKTGPLDPHRLTYFKCATTYLEEGQKKLLELHEGTASDVKTLIDRVLALEKYGDKFSDIESAVMGIMSEYTNLCKKVEQNREMIEKLNIDIQHLASKVEDLKSHDGIASDVKELIHQMSALKQNDANISDVHARVMELNCQYSNLYKQLQEVNGIADRNAADIQGLKRDMENVKLHEDISPKNLRWNIRDNVSNFCGRIEVLDKIHHYFQTTFDKKKYLAIALSGLGGIGKTEVAAKYINRYDKEYQNIIWLECNDIETSLVELASRMQIKTQVFKVNLLTQLICDKLGDGKCMFVLNDVVDNKSIKDFIKNLKNMKNTPCVIITSQYSEWDDVHIKHIPMDVFKSDEAVGFLCKCLPKYDPVEVETLVHDLQYLPLALQQAKSYILKHSMCIPDYIKYLKENRKELLNVRLDKKDETEYDKTLLTVWKMAFDKLKEHDNMLAIDILNMMAYMDGSFINTETFLYLNDIDKLQLNEAVEVLCEYSLIQGRTSKIITMHSLVQKITMLYEKEVMLPSNLSDTYALKLSKLLSNIAETQQLLDGDLKDLWFRHMKKLMLSQDNFCMPDLIRLITTAMVHGDWSFHTYLASVAVNMCKIVYNQSGKSEHFKLLIDYALQYANTFEVNRDGVRMLQFMHEFSTEFKNELAKKTADQIVWHYKHVLISIRSRKMEEAINLFDSLPDIKFCSEKITHSCLKKVEILCELGRKKEALLTNKQIFEYIISRNIVTDDYLSLTAFIGKIFLLLDDVEHAQLCVQYMENSLKKLELHDLTLFQFHLHKGNLYLYNHQYDECMDELNKCLTFPIGSMNIGLHVKIGYVQLKRKEFEKCKTTLLVVLELLDNATNCEERGFVLVCLAAALLCLDEIDEAEKILKSLKVDNYPGSFQEKYLEKINKFKILNNTFTYRRQRFGDKDAKTIAVLRECVHVKTELKECYIEVPVYYF